MTAAARPLHELPRDRVGEAARREALHRRRLPLIIALTGALVGVRLLEWGIERQSRAVLTPCPLPRP